MAESQPVEAKHIPLESESETEEISEQVDNAPAEPSSSTGEAAKKKKKKKSKRSKTASAPAGEKSTVAESTNPASKMSSEQISSLLERNPSLKGELAGLSLAQTEEILKKMDASQLLSGLSLGPSNPRDMASHKFWQTQPVPKFDDHAASSSGAPSKPDGPIKEVVPELVPKTPAPLPEGYEWCELDLLQESEIKEVYTLLTHHYVEDAEANFRFNYSEPFLNWALKSPDWKKSWHLGVRAKGPSRLLVATIFGIPTKLRVRENALDVVEINFLCVHKKLRSKRLAPVLIKEITRRCHLVGIYQAVYTAGVVLPTPVGSCRYFHRSLEWLKLYEVGFSPLPPNSTTERMIRYTQVPSETSTQGLRAMRGSDVDSVLDLLSRYLKRFKLAQDFTREEIVHWFLDVNLDAASQEDRVVWAFVVENREGKITDFVSFYCLESSVIGAASQKHDKVRAAYLFYYASETAFEAKEKGLKERLNMLIGDALIEAKKAKFDVFNALTLHDNPLFLEQLKFGAGDGQLHYYLYNWRTTPIAGGVNERNHPDHNQRGGIGMVLL